MVIDGCVARHCVLKRTVEGKFRRDGRPRKSLIFKAKDGITALCAFLNGKYNGSDHSIILHSLS